MRMSGDVGGLEEFIYDVIYVYDIDVDEVHGGWICRKGEAGKSI